MGGMGKVGAGQGRDELASAPLKIGYLSCLVSLFASLVSVLCCHGPFTKLQNCFALKGTTCTQLLVQEVMITLHARHSRDSQALRAAQLVGFANCHPHFTTERLLPLEPPVWATKSQGNIYVASRRGAAPCTPEFKYVESRCSHTDQPAGQTKPLAGTGCGGGQCQLFFFDRKVVCSFPQVQSVRVTVSSHRRVGEDYPHAVKIFYRA